MSHAAFTRNRLFHKLPESLALLLFEAGTVSIVPTGTEIVGEGEALDKLYIVLGGKAEVYLPQNESRFSPVKLSELAPGDCFGEYAFVDRQPASASIRAASDAEVYAIHFDTLHKFLDRHHSVASILYRNLLNILVERLRASNAELDLFTLSE
jgi:CRP-like cAMP-binding protein